MVFGPVNKYVTSGCRGEALGAIVYAIWWDVLRRRISRSGCACTPAFGRAEAPSARRFYGTRERVPFRIEAKVEICGWNPISEKRDMGFPAAKDFCQTCTALYGFYGSRSAKG